MRSFVKNHGLGFVVPYLHNGKPSDYVPDFADVRVLEGWDGDEPILVAPRTPPTVHQLVTHTSGLGYWFWNDDLVKYEAATGIPNVVPGSMDAFKAPMTAPGLYPEHDIFIQLMKLKNTLRFLKGEDLITHLGLEYYD